MPLSTPLSFLGIALEVTKGTAVAAAQFIPVDASTLAPIDHQMYLPDLALRGSMSKEYGEIPGALYSEFGFGGPVFADTIGWPLVGIFGVDAVTGGGAPFTHSLSLLNTSDGQAKSYTLTDFYGFTGTHSKTYAGMQFSDLNFTFAADGMLDYTAKAWGFGSALVAKPSQSFSVVTPEPGWEVAATIAGAGSSIVQSGTWNLTRPVSVIHTADGTAAPYKIWQGPLSASGTLLMVVEDDAEMIRYLTNTQPALVLDATHGASAALVELKLTATKCAYTDAKYQRGKDYVEVAVTWTAVANTTDVGASSGYGPCTAVIKNANASGTYI